MFKDITITCPTEECILRGGNDSPHRSTWENTKDWSLEPTIPASGTASTSTQVHYFVVTDGSGVVTASTTTSTTTIPLMASSTSYSIEIPPAFANSKEPLEMEVVHYQCPSSHPSSNDCSVLTSNEDADSMEAHSMMFQSVPSAPPPDFSRPKRCRSSSGCSMMGDDEDDQEMYNVGGMSWPNGTISIEPQSPVHFRPPAAKRRRLHSRKPALEAAGFDAILIRLEM